MNEGADGVQLDAAITKDGEIIVMHDDTARLHPDVINCAGGAGGTGGTGAGGAGGTTGAAARVA